VSRVRAHIKNNATVAAQTIGATTYATGIDVAFASAPDLHLVVYEVVYVV